MAHILDQYLSLETEKAWSLYFQWLSGACNLQTSGLSKNEAKKPDNRLLNRYRDILPYDHTRIQLESKPGYINASSVKYDNAQRNFILTQGPLHNTIRHFWQMVWEQGSSDIIMLNKIFERGRNKCAQYFPKNLQNQNDQVNQWSYRFVFEIVQ
ncbi:hypothetical protein ACOME3_001720 [Neoechinorhynchus agilis]